MKDLEANKLFASILIAALLAMFSGKIASFLYKSGDVSEKRGYQVEVAETEGSEAVEEVVISIPELMAVADATSGAKVFKKCAACHGVDEGGAHKVGPNLHAILGAGIAKKSGFAYSNVLSEMDKKWNYEELYAFLEKPKEYAPGTKMSFIGLRKPEQIANVMAYLRENGSQDYPLPEVVIQQEAAPEVQEQKPADAEALPTSDS